MLVLAVVDCFWCWLLVLAAGVLLLFACAGCCAVRLVAGMLAVGAGFGS